MWLTDALINLVDWVGEQVRTGCLPAAPARASAVTRS